MSDPNMKSEPMRVQVVTPNPRFLISRSGVGPEDLHTEEFPGALAVPGTVL